MATLSAWDSRLTQNTKLALAKEENKEKQLKENTKKSSSSSSSSSSKKSSSGWDSSVRQRTDNALGKGTSVYTGSKSSSAGSSKSSSGSKTASKSSSKKSTNTWSGSVTNKGTKLSTPKWKSTAQKLSGDTNERSAFDEDYQGYKGYEGYQKSKDAFSNTVGRKKFVPSQLLQNKMQSQISGDLFGNKPEADTSQESTERRRFVPTAVQTAQNGILSGVNGTVQKTNPTNDKTAQPVKKSEIFPNVSEELGNRLGALMLQYGEINSKASAGIERVKAVEKLVSDNRNVFDEYARQTGSQLTIPGLDYMYRQKSNSLVKEMVDKAQTEGTRPATFKDMTVNSFKRGYNNTIYGEENFKALTGEANRAEAYRQLLAGSDYNFEPQGIIPKAVSGVSQQLGQYYRNLTNPMTTAAMAGAAVGAGIAGQIGPQALVPEEIVTVPGAMTAAYTATSAANMFKVEAGHAYQEMIDNGITSDTASKIALGVGGVNAALEAVQVDDLMKSFKILGKNKATQGMAVEIADYLLKRGIHLGTETATEVAQEGSTIAGAQIANKMEKGEWAYNKKEVGDRLKDTAVSSALTFGAMGLTGDAVNIGNAARQQYNDTVNIGRAAKDNGIEQDIINTGAKRDESTPAYKYAQKMQQKQNKGADLSDWNVGRQYQKNVKAIDAENKFINDIANVTGAETQVHADMGGINGQFTSDDGQQRVDISANGDTSIPATAKHEFTHVFEQNAPTEYNTFKNYIIEAAAETNSDALNARLDSLRNTYEQRGLQYTEQLLQDEVAAELTNTFLTNPGSIEKIASGNTNLADKIINSIRTAKAKVKDRFYSPYANKQGVQITYAQLNEAEQLWNDALRQTAENRGNVSGENVTRNSIIQKDNGDYKIIADRDIFKDIAPEDRNAVLKNFINENLRGNQYTALTDGEVLNVAQKNKTVQKLYRPGIPMNSEKYSARQNAVTHYDEVLEASKKTGIQEAKNDKHNQTNVDKRNVEIEIPQYDDNGNLAGSSVWEAEISVLNDTKTAYDISKLRDITKNTHSDLRNLQEANPNIDRVSLSNIVSQQENFVKSNSYKNVSNAENEPIVKNPLKESTSDTQTNDLSTDECQKRFAENVDKVFSGEMPSRTVINIGDTPKLLQKYSASSVPITINQSVMYKIAYPAGYFGAENQGHNLGIPALKQLPKQIADPVAILKSTSQDKSMILLTEWQDTHENPVIIPLHLDKDGSIGIVNDIASAYGKQNFDTLLTDSEGNSTVLYTKNNEDIHRLTQSGLQLPGASTEDTLINYNIPNPKENVKFSIKESTNDETETGDADSATQDNIEIKPHGIQGTEGKTLIEAYNEASVSHTDREKFGKSDIIPKVKQCGVKFMAAQVDKLYPIKSYERFAEKQIHDGERVHFKGKNSPYVMSSNSVDAESRAKHLLTEELTDFDANPIGESLADIVGDLNYDDYKDFNTYLKLRHGLEWVTGEGKDYKPVFGNDILDSPDAMKNGIKQFEEIHPDFPDTAQRIYKYQSDMMKAWLVDTGVITQKQYDTLRQRYPDYVPFFRKDDTPTRGKKKTGIANQSDPIKEATGGQQLIYDPIENIMINTSKYVNAAAKNSAMQAVVNIYDSVPGMEKYMAEVVKDEETGKYKMQKVSAKAENTTESSPENTTENIETEEYISDTVQHAIKLTDGDIVTVLQNGQKRYFKVFDKDFLRSIDNMRPIQSGAIMRAVASATRVFSALATSNNPVFTLASNPIKDTQNAFVQSTRKNPFGVITGIVSAQFEQFENSKIGKKTVQKVTKNSDFDGTDAYKKYMAMGGEYASAFSSGRSAMKEALRDIKPDKKGAKAAAGKAVHFIPKLYGTVADAIETGPRLSEFKYSSKTGNDVHQAHFDSKDVTLNFGRSGYVGSQINKFVPFYNPSVQGISKMIQGFKNKPLQTSARVGVMVALSAISLLWNKFRHEESEEDYKNASSYLKNNYYLFSNGNGKFLKVPKSQEYGQIPSLIERTVEKYAYDNPDAFYNYADYMSTALLPSLFNAEFPFVDTGSVIGLGTYTSLLENKDFKGAPIVPDYLKDEVAAEQYDDRTSYIARWIGKKLNWSPKKIDYVIKSNTGFLGKINESVGHPGEKDWSMGVSTKFTADSLFSSDNANMFYENKDEADRQAKSYPTADSVYLSKRFEQSKDVLSILNKMYKEDSESDTGREIRRAYVNYAKNSKDNPTGLSDEVYGEIKDLFDTDKEALSLPTINRTIKAKIGKEDKSFTFTTAKSLMNYQDDLNRGVDEAYRELLGTVEYSAMSDIDKVKALNKAKKNVVDDIKRFYIESEAKKKYAENKSTEFGRDVFKPKTLKGTEDSTELEREKIRLKEYEDDRKLNLDSKKTYVTYDNVKYELTDTQAADYEKRVNDKVEEYQTKLIEGKIEDVIHDYTPNVYYDEMTEEQRQNALKSYKKEEDKQAFINGEKYKKLEITGLYSDLPNSLKKKVMDRAKKIATEDVEDEMMEDIKNNGTPRFTPTPRN